MKTTDTPRPYFAPNVVAMHIRDATAKSYIDVTPNPYRRRTYIRPSLGIALQTAILIALFAIIYYAVKP